MAQKPLDIKGILPRDKLLVIDRIITCKAGRKGKRNGGGKIDGRRVRAATGRERSRSLPAVKVCEGSAFANAKC